MIAIGGDVVEVRPLEVARGGAAEQQVSDVDSRVAGDGGEAVQPVDEVQVTITIDGDEPGADERSVVSEPAVDGVDRDSKEHGQRRTFEVDVPAGAAEDVINHRLDARMDLVAEQEFQDGDVGSRKVRCLREGSKPLRGAVESRRLRRCVFFVQDFRESAQLFLGHSLIGAQLHAAQVGPPSPRIARDPILPIGDPFGERGSLPVAVVKAGSGVGEVAGKQVSFVGSQHCSLRIRYVDRGYRAAASDPDVSVKNSASPARPDRDERNERKEEPRCLVPTRLGADESCGRLSFQTLSNLCDII